MKPHHEKLLKLLAISLAATACIAPASSLAFATTVSNTQPTLSYNRLAAKAANKSNHFIKVTQHSVASPAIPSRKTISLPVKGRLLILDPTSKSKGMNGKCNAVAGFFYGNFSPANLTSKGLGPVLLVGPNYMTNMKNLNHEEIGYMRGEMVFYHKCVYWSVWTGPFSHKNPEPTSTEEKAK